MEKRDEENRTGIRSLRNKAPAFDAFDTFPKPANVYSVTMKSDEVTGLCPVTTQPDHYTVEITYYPVARCLESKTLKLYLQTFRNRGIFVEALADLIADDIHGELDCVTEVTITQKARGGVGITVVARR